MWTFLLVFWWYYYFHFAVSLCVCDARFVSSFCFLFCLHRLSSGAENNRVGTFSLLTSVFQIFSTSVLLNSG